MLVTVILLRKHSLEPQYTFLFLFTKKKALMGQFIQLRADQLLAIH